VGDNIGLHLHACLFMGATLNLIHVNSRITQGLGTWSGGLAPGDPEAPKGGLCVVFPSIPFP